MVDFLLDYLVKPLAFMLCVVVVAYPALERDEELNPRLYDYILVGVALQTLCLALIGRHDFYVGGFVVALAIGVYGRWRRR